MFDNDPKLNLYKLLSQAKQDDEPEEDEVNAYNWHMQKNAPELAKQFLGESEGRSHAKEPFKLQDLQDTLDEYSKTLAPNFTPMKDERMPIAQFLDNSIKQAETEAEPVHNKAISPMSEEQLKAAPSEDPAQQPMEERQPAAEQPSEPQAPAKQEPQGLSAYDQLLADYGKYIESSKKSLSDARDLANKQDLYKAFSDSIQQAGTALANRGGITDFKPTEISKIGDPIAAAKEQMALEGSKFDKLKEFRSLAREQELHDPNSEQSKSVRRMMEAQFPELKDSYGDQWEQLPAASFDDVYKLLNLKETQKARVEAAQALAGEKKERQDLAREERQAEKAKLSDKQVEGINEFDDSINRAKYLLNTLTKDKSNWVGPVDSKIPDLLVGDDQVEFRAAVGRMSDAYRKLITGAGAGYQELQKLESRLPQTSDSVENFRAKAKDFIREIEKTRSTHLKNLESAGKRVDNFKTQQLSEETLLDKKFSPAIEAKIESAMKKNNASRETILQALKEQGKL